MKWSEAQLQQQAIPDRFGIGCMGGRGGGKTTGLFGLMARHAVQYGDAAKVLLLRRTYPSLSQPIENACATWHALGLPFTFNKNDGVVTFANRATCTFGPLETKDYFRQRWQGSSFSMLVHDELSSWATNELPDLSMSLLRAPAPIITRYCFATNPGPGYWLIPRYWRPALALPSGTPFAVEELGGREMVILRSTYKDNPFVPHADALRGIAAGAAGNRALRAQYETGDFDSHVGLFFELTANNFCDEWPPWFDPRDYPHIRVLIGYDHGSRAPWAAAWIARFRESGPGPDYRMYSKGSYVVFAEATSADPDNGYANATHHCDVGEVAGAILNTNERLHLKDVQVQADNAIFADHGSQNASLAAEFKRFGIPVVPAPKLRSRVTLARLRELIAGANYEATPGLYFVRRAVPYITTCFAQAVADERDNEALDANYALDHGIDAVKGAIEATTGRRASEVRTGPMFGTPLDNFEREARAYQAKRLNQDVARVRTSVPRQPLTKPPLDLDRIFARHPAEPATTESKPPLTTAPIVRTT